MLRRISAVNLFVSLCIQPYPTTNTAGTIACYRLPRAISASGRAAYVQTDDSGVERVVVHQLPRSWLN
jgi:hypothetical protein